MVAKFLVFIFYITIVFFLPNNWYLTVLLVVNLLFAIVVSLHVKQVTSWGIWLTTLKIVPIVLFTMIFNWWLDSLTAALWIGLKLLIVCNATMIYSASTTIHSVAILISKICSPLKYLGIKAEEVKLLVAISLMMIPILRKDIRELREAFKAKSASWNLSTVKMVLQKLGWTIIIQVNQLEEALLAKGSKI